MQLNFLQNINLLNKQNFISVNIGEQSAREEDPSIFLKKKADQAQHTTIMLLDWALINRQPHNMYEKTSISETSGF